MLLNPEDYSYKYFRQARGYDGESGKIHIGIPKKDDLCSILVKDNKVADAINEYIGCNIGQRIGVNTPRAWLFQTSSTAQRNRIHFDRAVGIEYLDGLDDNIDLLYDSEEHVVQIIQGCLLHKFINQDDHISLGIYRGKIYAFDFASGLYNRDVGRCIPETVKPLLHMEYRNGFSFVEDQLYRKEMSIRRDIWRYFKNLDKGELSEKLLQPVYENMRDRFVEQHNNHAFDDLIQEVETVFSSSAAEYVQALLDVMNRSLVAAF